MRVFASPGRVGRNRASNTDDNGGSRFPGGAYHAQTTIVARKRNDNIVNMAATELLADRVEVVKSSNHIGAYKDLRWGNDQAGIIAEMQKGGYEDRRL